MEDAYARSIAEVLDFFGVDPMKGLSDSQVTLHSKIHGKNVLPEETRTPFWKLVLKQFDDLLVKILIAAAAVSLVLALINGETGLTAFLEPFVILLILAANAAVGVITETNAERALEELRAYQADMATVLRNGCFSILPATELVPGDIVEVSVGCKVPADMRMIEMLSNQLRADQAILTGESCSVEKELEVTIATNAVYQDKTNILFSGTVVVAGRARAVVVGVGANTAMGSIRDSMLHTDDEVTPLKKKLDEFGTFLAKVITGICILVWIVNIGHFHDPSHGGFLRGAIHYFKIAVALAVAAIPEGLPAVVTTCLALGTKRMARLNAIVRSLPSVETLGCTTVICSDKTGTLTTNMMSVSKICAVHSVHHGPTIAEYSVSGTSYAPEGIIFGSSGMQIQFPAQLPSLLHVAMCSAICNESILQYNPDKGSYEKIGESTEVALRVLAEKSGPVDNHRGKKNLVLSAWGDDSQLSEDCINPHYISTSYQTYSEQTQKNLKRLNEEIIDYDLLEDLICYVDETCGEGAILIFLPGVSEIYMLLDRLVASYRFGGPSSDWVLPLHSSIASKDQKKVFLWPPENIRKVIIATNIAETSLTIDDVVYVIDCGKHKENRYNPQKKLTSMVEDWISQANARQRRGRAGRVKPGICFCLYTRHRFEKLMRPYQVPEMLRMPLVELSLQIKLLSLGHIKPFLSKALEPPREEAMTSAISLLYEVGALEGDEQLTPLGHHLAKLPVDVLIGKMLLYGAIFGCLSPILSISAFLSYKSPFVYPKDEKQNVERAKLALLADKIDGSNDSNYNDRLSDHLLMMVAYKKWEKILSERGFKAAQQFCATYFLSSSVMHMIRDMRTQFGTLLADIGLISIPKSYQVGRMKKENLDSWLSEKSQPFNMYSHHSSLVKAILCAGLYPNVAATELGITAATLNGLKQSSRPGKKDHPIWYDGRREVHIHPSSVNCNMKAFPHPFLVFLEKVETNKVFLRDTTIISPFSILLFGGEINIQHQTGLLTIDGWLKLKASAQYAVLFKELRSTLHALLKELIRKPENATLVDNEVVKSMIQLLLDEDKPQT